MVGKQTVSLACSEITVYHPDNMSMVEYTSFIYRNGVYNYRSTSAPSYSMEKHLVRPELSLIE